MNLREVVRTLRFERRRVLALSRVCDPVFAKDYERTARALGIAADRSLRGRAISTGERTAEKGKLEVIENPAKSALDGARLGRG